MGTIAIISCCDTKYHEITFVRQHVLQAGHTPLVVDISTGPNLPITGDITRERVLEFGGYTWNDIRTNSKSYAIAAMTQSIVKAIQSLYEQKQIDGVLGMGGLQNTVVCSAACRTLPIGFPKLIVSTIASGYRYFDTVVGEKDIMVLPSVVDFAGMNVIAESVLSNAVAAICGMVSNGGTALNTQGHFIIGTTLMGITNDTVMSLSNQLTEARKEVISFHSTGVGGRVMESMIQNGHVKAVADLTLHEMTAEYFGGYGYSKGADQRLCAGAEMGIPMLVCPGGIDFICLRPDELFPDQEKRGYVWHNPDLTHTKLYESEILDITRTIVQRLNVARGPVEVVLPMGGLRTLSGPGEPFHKPETIEKMRRIFQQELKPTITLCCVEYNFTDPAFADFLTQEMLQLLERHKGGLS